MKPLVSISLALLVAAVLGTSPARALDPRQHPALANAPRITHAPNGAAGDPVNIAFIGSEEDLASVPDLGQMGPGRSDHAQVIDADRRRHDVSPFLH